MPAKHWMKAAFANAHGQLRKKLKAKKGKPIAAGKLAAATHSASTTTKRQAVLAQTARRTAGKRTKTHAEILYGK